MRVTLTAPIVQRLRESFGDFEKATVNEVLALLIAERNTLRDCLHSGNHSSGQVEPVAPAATLSDFAGMLDD